MQMSRFLYINRSWKTDEKKMERMLDYLAEDERPHQLILFPEGTNLTMETKSKSDAFAKKWDLTPYTHVLHPRTTGFGFIANKMRESKIVQFNL